MNRADPAFAVLLRIDRAAGRHTRHPRHLHPALDLRIVQAEIAKRSGTPPPLLDGWLAPFDVPGFIARALAHSPRVAVIRGVTWCLDESIAVAEGLRRAGVITIAVGQQVQHVARCPRPSWTRAYDLAIAGEPEQAAGEIVAQLAAGMPLEALRARWPAHGTGSLTLVELPDSLAIPKPARDELGLYPFPFPVRGRPVRRWGYLLTAWGCPRPCRHCTAIVRKSVGERLRTRSLALVLDEIAGMVDAGADGLAFEDDSLFVSKARVFELANGLIRRGLRLPWMANARPDELDAERIDAARASGAVLIKIGVDTGSPRLIESIGKASDGDVWIAASRSAFAGLDAVGIGTVSLFMLGLPGETVEDAEATIALARSLPADYLQLQRYQAYPDVKAWSELSGRDGADYHYAPDATATGDLAPDRLSSMQRALYRDFYLQPRFVLRHLKHCWRHYLPGMQRPGGTMQALNFLLRSA